MTNGQPSRSRSGWSAAIVGLWVLIGGCAGPGSVGPAVQLPADKQQRVEQSAVGTVIELPADRPFNIHVKQSSQNPGADGEANGAADAQGTGSAMCSASAAHGGISTAQFQLGQAIDYRGAAPVAMAVKLQSTIAYKLDAKQLDFDTNGAVTLSVYVKDSEGQVLTNMTLDTLTCDAVNGSGERQDVREFLFTMQPERTYQIVLFGTASATTTAESATAVDLAVKDVMMTLRVQEPVATASAQ